MSKKLTITNHRVVEFFAKHSNIDVDTCMTIMVDMLEHILTSTNNQLSIQQNIAERLMECNTKMLHKFEELNKKIDTNNTIITAEIMNKMVDNKREYIDDVRTNVQLVVMEILNKNNETIKNNSELYYERSNNIISNTLRDHSTLLLQNIVDTIPKTIVDENTTIQTAIAQLEKSINTDLEKLYHRENDTMLKVLSTLNSAEKSHTVLADINQQLALSSTTLLNEYIGSLDTKLTNFLTNINTVLSKVDTILNIPDDIAGEDSDVRIRNILDKLYQSAEVSLNSVGSTIIKRPGFSNVLVQLRDYSHKIPTLEVDHFVSVCETYPINGLLISNKNGICGRYDYQIEIKNNRILVYLHNVNNSHNKIQAAMDIIDALDKTLKTLNIDGHNTHLIPDNVLDEINKEYKNMLAKKENIKKYISDITRELNTQIDDLKFNALEAYLRTKFNYSHTTEQLFKCPNCGKLCLNKKGLTTHLNTCKTQRLSTETETTPTTITHKHGNKTINVNIDKPPVNINDVIDINDIVDNMSNK